MNNNTLVQFFKLTENDKNNLPLKEGQIIFTTDTHKLFLDINDSTRIQIQGVDYTAGTGLNLSGTEFSNAGVRSITTGSTNGTINIDTNGTAAEVAVAGLGSLAYKSSLTASEVGAIDSTLKGANNGVAELDSTGKIPSSQLPSYVDDVLEYPTVGDFPATGETGKIYVDTTTNKTYRWGGSSYVVISETLALGETSSTAYRGDRGKTAYDHALDSNKISSATATGLYKVGATAEGHVSGLTAVTKSDITALGILDDITISPVANTGSSIGTITVDNTTYDFKLPAQVGNEVRISSTQPQDNNWKLWVDSDEITPINTEVVDEYSTSHGLAYSADYINKMHTYSTNEFKVGKWTNGVDVYGKVYIGTLSTTSNDTSVGSITSTYNNLITLRGTIWGPTDKKLPLPFYYGSSDYCKLYVDRWEAIYIESIKETYGGSHYIVYVEYTKMS